MGQADQAVVLRVAAGEEGTARRRAQRRGGVCAREKDPFLGEFVKPRTRDVGMVVNAEIAPEVVPMHEQHVVSSLDHWASFLIPSVHLTRCPVDSATLWLTEGNYPQSEFHPQARRVASCQDARVGGSGCLIRVCAFGDAGSGFAGG